MSAEHTYKFNVSMSCGGCSGAVNRVLGKLEGVSPSLPLALPHPCYNYPSPSSNPFPIHRTHHILKLI